MGLCLIVFDADPMEDDSEEIAECEVGHYSDFGYFRDTIARHLDASAYPVLMEHSNSDGEWKVSELPQLKQELRTIAKHFSKLDPEEPQNAFEHTAAERTGATSLYHCFHNVDGENLFEALTELSNIGIQHSRPITFM